MQAQEPVISQASSRDPSPTSPPCLPRPAPPRPVRPAPPRPTAGDAATGGVSASAGRLLTLVAAAVATGPLGRGQWGRDTAQ